MKTTNKSGFKFHDCLMVITVLLLLTAVTGCSGADAEKKLTALINKAIRSNNDVDETEWKGIVNYTREQRDGLSEYINTQGSPDSEKLRQYILRIAKRRREKLADPDIYIEKDVTQAKPHFNIYIENSMSMDGYVNGNTQFEGAITKLMVLIKNYSGQDKLHINFVNSKIIAATQVDITNFAQKLEPKSVTYNVGGQARTISDLNNVFRMVLDSTANGVSVLISDCIYSLGKVGDTEGSLNIQKSLTMDAFLDKLRSSQLATICLKLNSNFNGVYYDMKNAKTNLNINDRPYYIWLMGPRNLLEDFYATLKPEADLDGYRNSFILFPAAGGKEPYFTVLKETEKRGSFKTDRASRDFVHAIDDIGYDDGLLQFTVALDLSKVPVDTSYLFDKNNYKLPDGFKLTDIKKLTRNNVSKRDWVSVEKTGTTHLLTIQIPKEFTLQNLKLELLRQIPAWVGQTHCSDDADIRNLASKTFGLKHLVEGVNEAYKKHDPANQAFFTVTVNIKK
jgi:hypothetical protein